MRNYEGNINYQSELQNIYDEIVVVHSNESQGELDITNSDIHSMCIQVSAEIDKYNQEHHGEMLSQKAEDLYQQFQSRNSLIIAGKNFDNSWQFLHHRTTYELLKPNQKEALGGWNVIECGTAITHKPYRSGYKLGQQGIALLREKIDDMWGDNTVIIATIKQHITGVVLGKSGASAIAWHTHPYLSFLTDSCDSSPTHTGVACAYRRSIENSTTPELFAATNNRGGKMSCTMITFDENKAREFDDVARNLHFQNTGEFIEANVDDRTNPQAWINMQTFYKSIN